MATLHDDWNEFLRLLRAHRVRFVVVGGHAVAAHGHPRFTGDLDILIEPTLANAQRTVAAIAAFGFGNVEPSVLTRSDQVVFMGREPFRIDVLTSIDAVDFPSAWAGRITGTLGRERVAFIGHAELLRNKRAAGRPKDLLDVALLKDIPIKTKKRSTKTRKRSTKRRSKKK